MQFVKGVSESAVPDVKLTRARDGSSGTAIFFFESPDVFEAANEGAGEITGLYLVDSEGTLSTVDVSAKFVNGKPKGIEAKYTMRSAFEWDRFMRFMERYAEDHGACRAAAAAIRAPHAAAGCKAARARQPRASGLVAHTFLYAPARQAWASPSRPAAPPELHCGVGWAGRPRAAGPWQKNARCRVARGRGAPAAALCAQLRACCVANRVDVTRAVSVPRQLPQAARCRLRKRAPALQRRHRALS